MKFSNCFLVIIFILGTYKCYTQCADSSNIYSFEYNGHTYNVVKENRTWINASSCAVSLNGYLAEINDVDEQNAIFTELTDNAGINISNTENQFGTASVWIGGSDSVEEGNWIWDGDNDGNGQQFWSGGPNGTPIGGQYTNWGTSPPEPDNSGGQDHLTIIIKPSAINYSKWNDLVSSNSIYYLIEYNTILSSVSHQELKENIRIFPNPFSDRLSIENFNSEKIEKVEIYNNIGEKLKLFRFDGMIAINIDVSELDKNLYYVLVFFMNGEVTHNKVIKY